MLHAKVFELAIVVRVILPESGNGTAVTRDVDTSQTWIKLDDVRPAGHFEKRDRDMLVQVEHGHHFISFTRKKRTVMFGVKRHPVIALAFADWIFRHDFIG